MDNDEEFLASIRKIDEAIPASVAGPGAQVAAVPDLGQICDVIKRIEGPLRFVIPLIEKIPVYGATVAKALTLLLGLAATVCPK